MAFGKDESKIYGKLDRNFSRSSMRGRRAFKEKNIRLDNAIERSGKEVDRDIGGFMAGRRKAATMGLKKKGNIFG